MLFGVGNVFAADVVWDGDTDDNWSTAGNWVGGAPPVNTDRVIFSAASDDNLAGGVNDIDMSGFAAGIIIQVTNVAGPVSFANNAAMDLNTSVLAIDLTGAAAGLTITGASQITLNGAATFDTDQTLTIAPPIANTGGHLTVQGSGTTTLTGIFSGANNIIKDETGILILSGANTITGDITLTAGTLSSNNADAIDTSATLTLTAGVFNINAALLTGKWPTTVTIGATTPIIDVDAPSVCNVALGAGTNSYSVTGSAELEITTANTGSGTLTVNEANVSLKLSAASSATGPLTLTAGTIEANHATAIDTYGAFTVTAGTLIISTTIASGAWPTSIAIGVGTPVIDVDAASVCNVAIGAGENNYSVTGSAELQLTVANTGAGTLTVNEANAVLKLSAASAATGPLTLTAGTVISDHATAIDTYTTLTLTAGTLNLFKTIAAGAWPTSIVIGASAPIIDVDAASVCDVVIVGGANNYSVTGSAELELQAANTGNGTLTVNEANAVLKLSVGSAATGPLTQTAGNIEANHATAVDTYSNLTLTANTFIITTGIAAGAWPTAITIGATTPTIQNDAATTVIDEDITTAGNNFSLTGAQNIEISGAIGAGATVLTVNMSALAQVVTLSGTNTYTGLTTITRGTVSAEDAVALGTVAAGTTVAATVAKLQLDGGIAVGAEALTINGGVAGELESVSGTNSWAGTVTLATAATNDILVTAGTLTISGVVSGALAVEKTGAGKLILSGTNTYTGDTTVTAGTLNVQDAAGLGTTAGNTIVAAAALLELEGGSAVAVGEDLTLNGGVCFTNVSGTNSWAGAIALLTGATTITSTAGTMTLSSTNNGAQNLIFTGAGDFVVSGVVSGTATVTKRGAGVLTLSGNNTYAGLTTLTTGTILANGTMDNANKGGFIVATGATLGGTGTIKSLITIQRGGILKPGNISGVGTLSTLFAGNAFAADGNVNIQAGGKLSTVQTGAGTNLLAVGAGRTLTVSATALILGSGTPTSGTTFTVATATVYTGTAFATGSLAAGYTQANNVNTSVTLAYVTPGPPPVIPTLNEWGMIITLILLAGIGFAMMRKREESMGDFAA